MTTTTTQRYECPWCNGTGKKTWYSHIHNGDCFDCGALGYFETYEKFKETEARKGWRLQHPTSLHRATFKKTGSDTMSVLLEHRHCVTGEPGCGDEYVVDEYTIKKAREFYKGFLLKGYVRV